MRKREQETEENSIATQKRTKNNQTSPSSRGRLWFEREKSLGWSEQATKRNIPKKEQKRNGKKRAVHVRKTSGLLGRLNATIHKMCKNKCSAIIVCESDFHIKLQSMVGRVHVENLNSSTGAYKWNWKFTAYPAHRNHSQNAQSKNSSRSKKKN